MSEREMAENHLAPAGMKINQEYFDRLPALLSPYQMRLVTGLDWRKLQVLEQTKTIGVCLLPVRQGNKRSYRRYYKSDAGKLAGFRM